MISNAMSFCHLFERNFRVSREIEFFFRAMKDSFIRDFDDVSVVVSHFFDEFTDYDANSMIRDSENLHFLGYHRLIENR